MMECDGFPPLLGEGQGGVGHTANKARIYTRETLRRSRTLRKNLTKAEKKLWHYLRKEQMEGYKFRRQYFIGKYIADFVCVECRLVVEADGGQHSENNYDSGRDAFIRAQGYHVLRFWNNDVLQNIEGVMETIREFLLNQTSSEVPHPMPSLSLPLLGGGEVGVSHADMNCEQRGGLGATPRPHSDKNSQPHPNPFLRGEGIDGTVLAINEKAECAANPTLPPLKGEELHRFALQDRKKEL